MMSFRNATLVQKWCRRTCGSVSNGTLRGRRGTMCKFETKEATPLMLGIAFLCNFCVRSYHQRSLA